MEAAISHSWEQSLAHASPQQRESWEAMLEEQEAEKLAGLSCAK